jgi:hypothetical protein
MNLEQKITEKLNAIRRTENEKPTGKDSGYVVEEELDSIRLRAEIQDFDKFSYMVKTLSVTQTPASGAPIKALLLQQAHEIERRLSYLLESFRLVELDEINGLAQVRSVSPYKKNDETFYYEALLQHGNSVTFARYRMQQQAEKREIVPSHLTQETFERLINDLMATLQIIPD